MTSLTVTLHGPTAHHEGHDEHDVAALRFFVKTLTRRYLLDDTPYSKAPRRLPQILARAA